MDLLLFIVLSTCLVVSYLGYETILLYKLEQIDAANIYETHGIIRDIKSVYRPHGILFRKYTIELPDNQTIKIRSTVSDVQIGDEIIVYNNGEQYDMFPDMSAVGTSILISLTVKYFFIAYVFLSVLEHYFGIDALIPVIVLTVRNWLVWTS